MARVLAEAEAGPGQEEGSAATGAPALPSPEAA